MCSIIMYNYGPYIACVVIMIIFSSGHSESEVALFETCLSYLSSLLDVSQ